MFDHFRKQPFGLSALFAATLVMAAAGCRPDPPTECVEPIGATPLEIDIPPFFPPMDIPPDNPMTVEGVELGRLLFWEKGLSADSTQSCGSCHLPSFSFADPNPVSTGVTGAQGTRNAMALVNMGWAQHFFWDGRAATLEEQILDPVPHPDEMNLPWDEAVARLSGDPDTWNASGWPSVRTASLRKPPRKPLPSSCAPWCPQTANSTAGAGAKPS